MGYKDPEKAAAYAREWRANHSEKVLADDRKRRAKERIENPSAATQRMREWRAANPEKAKAQAKIGNEKFKQRLATYPVFKEDRRQKRVVYTGSPVVREKLRKKWRAWAKEDRAKDPNHHRGLQIKSLYGITFEQYESMVLAQNGRCAICRTDKPGGRGRWHIDHCHIQDQVRELLCHGCNVGLGSFKDDPARLQAAIAYLERHRKP